MNEEYFGAFKAKVKNVQNTMGKGKGLCHFIRDINLSLLTFYAKKHVH